MTRCEYRGCASPATVWLALEQRPYPPEEGREDGPSTITTRLVCAPHRDVILSRWDEAAA